MGSQSSVGDMGDPGPGLPLSLPALKLYAHLFCPLIILIPLVYTVYPALSPGNRRMTEFTGEQKSLLVSEPRGVVRGLVCTHRTFADAGVPGRLLCLSALVSGLGRRSQDARKLRTGLVLGSEVTRVSDWT